MTVEKTVSDHYTTGALLARIRDGLAKAGVDPESPTPEDLKPVDEFHIGGVGATKELIEQAGISAEMQVLDIGSGLGGTPRFVASTVGCTVTGIDLTPEFVETATALSAMSGMSDRTRFQVGSALDLPFDASSFDRATLLHVGMNIPDKPRLMAEAARTLKPGGLFAVYDVMRMNDEDLVFPLPWAGTPDASFVERLEDYSDAATDAGFEIVASRGRREFALDFFAKMQAGMASAGGPPPLGLHLIMQDAATKIGNMIANIQAGRIEPTELILRKPA